MIDNFSRFVCSAYFAYVVSKLHFSALFTFYHARHSQFEMRAAFVAARFGRSPLRYCHGSHLLIQVNPGSGLFNTLIYSLKKSLSEARRGSIRSVLQPQSRSFRSVPQLGQSPLQSSLHKAANGRFRRKDSSMYGTRST